MSIALVPIKHLASGKSRLASRLSRVDLESLTLAMLDDVVAALRATPSVDRVAVTTPDPIVAKHATAAGAEALLRDDPGLNPAIDAAAQVLSLAPQEPWLVVLGDVAAADSDDLEALFAALRALGGRGVVVAPSGDGGTSALLRAPAGIVPSRFGVDSASLHCAAAAESAVPWRSLDLASLATDLDRPEDVQRFLDAGCGGARTRALLARLQWSAG